MKSNSLGASQNPICGSPNSVALFAFCYRVHLAKCSGTAIQSVTMSTSIELPSGDSSVHEAASFLDDCLPPEAEYHSRKELVEAIDTWAATRGYAFIARSSTTKSSGRRIVMYACDRSWPAEVSTGNEPKRKTTARGTSCPFSVLAKESLDKMTWSLHHRPDIQHTKHNHEPSHHPSAHPTRRQLDDSNKATVSELVSAGVSPRDIQTYLRQQILSC